MSVPKTDDRGLPANYRLTPEWEVSPRELKEKLDRGEPVVLIDVRLEPEFAFARIAGSVHIPLHELGPRADEVEAPPGAAVVAICHHGRRSLQAAEILRQAGVPGVKSLAGGIECWSLAIDHAVPRYERDGSKVWPAGSRVK